MELWRPSNAIFVCVTKSILPILSYKDTKTVFENVSFEKRRGISFWIKFDLESLSLLALQRISKFNLKFDVSWS